MSDPELPTEEEAEAAVLADLAARFERALEHVRTGNVDGAADLLRGILRQEPRLPEPRLELARVCMDTGQLEEAEEHAREALALLERGGQWVEDLPEQTVQSVAHGLLGEILRRTADSDEVVFGAPDRWKTLMAEARESFRKAAVLDPANLHAAYWGFGLSPGEGGAEDGEENLAEDEEAAEE